MISLQKLNLSLPSRAGLVPILHEIDLDVPAGETVAVIGPSGSGKTSMMMVIAGLEQASSGRVLVAGQDITNAEEDELALFRRAHIGIVFQSFHLIPTMTALENVMIPLEFAGHAHAREEARDALAAVGLAERAEHYPAQLSGGEQQRVAIARAFVMKPKLLLADEPTGNLDHETGEQITELLFSLNARHRATLLLITHSAELAARCSRQVRVMDGRIV